MTTRNTNSTGASTLFQRFLDRLCDPSPARYSAAIQRRTFGRVVLDDAPAPCNTTETPAKPQARPITTTSHHAAA